MLTQVLLLGLAFAGNQVFDHATPTGGPTMSSCSSISDNDMRYFCDGSCSSIGQNDMRYYCQGSCSSIGNNDVR